MWVGGLKVASACLTSCLKLIHFLQWQCFVMKYEISVLFCKSYEKVWVVGIFPWVCASAVFLIVFSRHKAACGVKVFSSPHRHIMFSFPYRDIQDIFVFWRRHLLFIFVHVRALFVSVLWENSELTKILCKGFMHNRKLIWLTSSTLLRHI